MQFQWGSLVAAMKLVQQGLTQLLQSLMAQPCTALLVILLLSNRLWLCSTNRSKKGLCWTSCHAEELAVEAPQ